MRTEVLFHTLKVDQLLIFDSQLLNHFVDVYMIRNVYLLDLVLKFAESLRLVLFVLKQSHSLLLTKLKLLFQLLNDLLTLRE